MTAVKQPSRITLGRRPPPRHRLCIAIDIDGTLADQVPHVLARASKEKGIAMTKSEITSWDTPVGGEPFDQLIHRYLLDSKFVLSMPSFPGAAEATNRIRQRFDLVIGSSRPVSTETATLSWLFTVLGWSPRYQNTESTGKAVLDADVLIDDSDKNLLDFVMHLPEGARTPCQVLGRSAILMKQPWNGKDERLLRLVQSGRVRIANGWPEVLQLLRLTGGPAHRSQSGTESVGLTGIRGDITPLSNPPKSRTQRRVHRRP